MASLVWVTYQTNKISLERNLNYNNSNISYITRTNKNWGRLLKLQSYTNSNVVEPVGRQNNYCCVIDKQTKNSRSGGNKSWLPPPTLCVTWAVDMRLQQSTQRQQNCYFSAQEYAICQPILDSFAENWNLIPRIFIYISIYYWGFNPSLLGIHSSKPFDSIIVLISFPSSGNWKVLQKEDSADFSCWTSLKKQGRLGHTLKLFLFTKKFINRS